MELTKTQQQEIIRVHDAYWISYLQGDIPAMVHLLDENYSQVGSAETEVFSNKKDAVQFLYDTIDQVAGKLEMRNRITKLEILDLKRRGVSEDTPSLNEDSPCLIHERADIYVLTGEEWIFYSKFRATTLMQKKNGVWKIIHQHSSFPDTRAGEGQNIATEKIAAENLQLREAVKRRTIELEQKNRELEIEAALERMRASAMAMHNTEGLYDTAEILYQELSQLGIKNSSSGFGLVDENANRISFYGINPTDGKILRYAYHVPIIKKAKAIQSFYLNWKKHAESTIIELNKQETKAHETYVAKCALASFKEYGIESHFTIEEWLANSPKEVKLHFFNFRQGCIYSIRDNRLTDVQQEIVARFTKVFQLTYTRFLDLQKAEAQAREAEIELALERIRAKTMALQKSSELSDVIAVVFEQLTALGFTSEGCDIIIYDKEKLDAQYWFAGFEKGSDPKSYLVPYHKHPYYLSQVDGWKNGEKYKAIVFEGELKKKLDDHVFTKTGFKNFPESRKELLKSLKYAVMHDAFMSHGIVETIDLETISNEKALILQRIAKVFEQAYTRFLDLQKAETQAREAQIEAALERVRAQSMAMHKSDELRKTVAMLYKEMKSLGFDSQACAIVLYNETDRTVSHWVSGFAKNMFPQSYSHPYFDHFYFQNQLDAWKSGVSYKVFVFEGRLKKSYDKKIFALGDMNDFPADAKMAVSGMEKLVLSDAYMKYGMLEVISDHELDNKSARTLQRFSQVFEQTYTRFLDLQKAEAQAREAQIEASLERVRARTMAMHKSEELSDCAELLFNELSELGGSLWTSGFAILENDDQGEGEYRTTDQFGTREEVSFIPNWWDPTMEYLYEGWKQKEQYRSYNLGGEEIKQHYNNMLVLPKSGHVFQVVLDAGQLFPEWQQMHAAYFKQGYLLVISLDTYKESDLLIRFARVFEQTYTRFLDLQKAEAQAREAQIQLALERVRARTMAMQSSEELADVVAVFYEQLNPIGVAKWGCTIMIFNEEKQSIENWFSGLVQSNVPQCFYWVGQEHSVVKELWNSWKAQVPVFNMHLKDAVKLDFDTYLMTRTGYANLPEPVKNGIMSEPEVYFTFASTRYGLLHADDLKPITEENSLILQRFAKVFEQTYTRFLDLQKAEAQAREAQIEAALERVRASMMAMHKTEELHEVLGAIFTQLQSLGFDAPGSALIIYNKELAAEHWMTGFSGGQFPESYKIPYVEHPYFTDLLHAWQNGVPFQEFIFEGDLKLEYGKWCLENSDFKRMPPEFKKEMVTPDRMVISDAFNKYGMIEILGLDSLSEESVNVLKRFSKVFEQTYTRFLDLQKAEEQAREAQIEAALERVRARTMGMHKSNEMLEVGELLYKQLSELGISSMTSGVTLIDINDKMDSYYVVSPEDGSIMKEAMGIPRDETKVMRSLTEAWEKQKPYHIISLNEKETIIHQTYIAENSTNFPFSAAELISFTPKRLNLQTFNFKQGYLILVGADKLSEEKINTTIRFARAFEQTYTRFLDLKKAEAQAREAQIEAALERVRSRSMAMQHSSELNDILKTMFGELSSLGLALARCVIWTYNSEDRSARWWAANPESESGTESFLIPYTNHPTCNEYWKSWEERRARFFYELSGETKRTWDDYLFNYTELARLPEPVIAAMKAPDKVLLYNSFRDFGVLYTVSLEPIGEENFDIIERFGKVFDQSYIRFNDIKQAEAREKEAIKQSSLDRVRAEIASMRTTNDLDRITPLIWKELSTLNIPFVRCGVFIMDETLQQIHTFLSTPDGKAIAAFHLPYETPTRAREILANWMKKQEYIEHWDEAAFGELGDQLVRQGSLHSKDVYLKTIPQGGIYLHCLPFLQGMLYVGNTEKLKTENIQLIQSVADAFSTAYARYEDFNKLEAAKQQVDKTLVDLKQAQQQLVQSEKMASLGELTAGIAHEIQNPLNFVNNFAEINKELLDELKGQRLKGKGERDEQAETDILKDIEENEFKILQHGKRADAIVKGMLQHSRTSTGTKEPTDINALADEYIRLAYHGLRAKDKSFNAEFKMDLDPMLPLVNVIPQDIGRVLLNLFNNAFWACAERSRNLRHQKSKNVEQDLEGFHQVSQEPNLPGLVPIYSPIVTLTTKNIGSKIEIRIRDNGSGIPQHVLDKIFQPFFTTKPTGQGTGLGLSLAYDIVKAHGGEIIVKSKEYEGSEFIVQLPV